MRFGLRDYEPQSGRFTARDPAMLAGSPRSIFGYANNSPLSYRDPGGTASLSFSAYEGIGGGVSLYFDPSAIFDRNKPFITGLCFEAGVGAGRRPRGRPRGEGEPRRRHLRRRGTGGEDPLPRGQARRRVRPHLRHGQGQAGRQPRALGAQRQPINGDQSNTGSLDPSAESLRELAAGTMNMKVEGKLALKGCLPAVDR